MALAWNGAVAVYRVAICLGSVQGANFVPQLGVISEGAQLLTWIVSSFNDLREKDEELNSTELRFQLVRTRYDNVSKQCLARSSMTSRNSEAIKVTLEQCVVHIRGFEKALSEAQAVLGAGDAPAAKVAEIGNSPSPQPALTGAGEPANTGLVGRMKGRAAKVAQRVAETKPIRGLRAGKPLNEATEILSKITALLDELEKMLASEMNAYFTAMLAADRLRMQAGQLAPSAKEVASAVIASEAADATMANGLLGSLVINSNEPGRTGAQVLVDKLRDWHAFHDPDFTVSVRFLAPLVSGAGDVLPVIPVQRNPETIFTFEITASRDCDCFFFYASAAGDVLCGLPKFDPDTKQYLDNRLAAHQPRSFPDAKLDNGYVISPDFDAPIGNDHVIVFAVESAADVAAATPSSSKLRKLLEVAATLLHEGGSDGADRSELERLLNLHYKDEGVSYTYTVFRFCMVEEKEPQQGDAAAAAAAAGAATAPLAKAAMAQLEEGPDVAGGVAKRSRGEDGEREAIDDPTRPEAKKQMGSSAGGGGGGGGVGGKP